MYMLTGHKINVTQPDSSSAKKLVTKRDGSVVAWNQETVEFALRRAFDAAGLEQDNSIVVTALAQKVANKAQIYSSKGKPIFIEDLQDIMERVIMVCHLKYPIEKNRNSERVTSICLKLHN